MAVTLSEKLNLTFIAPMIFKTPSVCKRVAKPLADIFPEITKTLKTTQVVVGAGIAVNVVASSFSAGSPNSVFALINQLQLFIILMAIKTKIPLAIRQYIASYDFVILNFSFSPVPEWPLFNAPLKYMGGKEPYEIQENCGLEYRSGFLNIYALLLATSVIVIIHLIIAFTPILKKHEPTDLPSNIEFMTGEEIERFEIESESKLRALCRKIRDKILFLLRYKLYVKLIMETQTLLLLASLTEISRFYIEERPFVASILISFVILFFCIFILVIQCYFAYYYAQDEEEKFFLQEIFVVCKDKKNARVLSAIQQLRRVVNVSSIIVFNYVHRIAVF